jgi:hypothetical protein
MFMKRNHTRKLLAALPLIYAATAQAASQDALFLTATNGASNYLAIVNTKTQEMNFVPTGGSGGASGNAGGVAVSGTLAAVVNFGSTNVTIFVRQGNAMQPTQVIKTSSQPVSVAFGHDHLLVLGQTTAESFPVYGTNVATSNDGVVQLLKSDKTAGQIISYNGGAVYTETSGNVSELTVSTDGAPGIAGPSVPVVLPAAPNNNTPLGMIGRGANVYVTIAHSDLQALVVNGKIVSLAEGPTPFMNSSGGLTHAPCWNALYEQFLFSSDSPGGQLLRFLVSDSNVFYDKPVATLTGSPADLSVVNSLLGVIDAGDGVNSDVSLFNISSEGELTLSFKLKIPSPINGAAIIE